MAHATKPEVLFLCIAWISRQQSKSVAPIVTMSKRQSRCPWEHNSCIVCAVNIDVLDCFLKNHGEFISWAWSSAGARLNQCPRCAYDRNWPWRLTASEVQTCSFLNTGCVFCGCFEGSFWTSGSFWWMIILQCDIVESCWLWFVGMQIDVNSWLQNFHFLKEGQCRTSPLVASMHWFDSKRISWLQGPCCNVAKWKNRLRGPCALKPGFGLQRRHAVCGCLLWQVPLPGSCQSIPSSSRPEAVWICWVFGSLSKECCLV